MARTKEMKDPLVIEVQKINASVEKYYEVFNTIRHFITAMTVIIAVHIFFEGLKPFLSSRPEVINAIVKIIRSINPGNSLSYIVSLGCGTAWYLERNGKKRAIKDKGKYQKMAESNDEYRSSSGLTESGDTPKGEHK